MLARFILTSSLALALFALLCMLLIATYANAQTMVIEPGACQALTAAAPAGAAYQPGVDVNGNAVAPADLPASPSAQSLPVNIYVTPAMASKMGIKMPANLGNNAILGTIGVNGNQVTFNGQPLTGQIQASLAPLCAHR